jgi:type II secretory ATPase GspE/PulE/Tfp pilus assembly ATPase PilB-like protein
VISRIKILADLDISEKRLPQDGRIGIVIDGRRIDIRVAVMPLVDGESAVLRILDAGRSPLSLDDLGMSAEDRERLERTRSHPRRRSSRPARRARARRPRCTR